MKQKKEPALHANSLIKYSVFRLVLFWISFGFFDVPAADTIGASMNHGIAFIRFCGSVIFASGTEFFDILVNFIEHS